MLGMHEVYEECYVLKFLTVLLSLCFFTNAQAIQCFFTLVKDSCWKNYNVNVDLMNASNGKKIISMIVPEGQSWLRQPFTCSPGDTLSLQATFNPAFWESEADKVYSGKNYWGLPKVLAEGEVAWNVTICYPKDFSEVPMPPDANGKCKCDLSSIPSVEPM
jgi:hypothetical protein